MAYDAPTAADITARFPVFADVDPAVINAMIEEAARFLDEAWNEDDYPIAYRYLVAHMLVMEGALQSSGGPGVATGPIQSEKLGDASVTYAQPGASSGAFSEFMQTVYGRRYLEIMRRNLPLVIVV